MEKLSRVQWFEFEDLDWIPGWVRSSITNLVVIVNDLFGVRETIPVVLEDVLTKTNKKVIVDLGSGAGGVMPQIVKELQRRSRFRDVKLIMTDRFPNLDAIEKYNFPNDPLISYSPIPLNALELENAPDGLKTMINCFHHLNPEEARKLLLSAQKNKEPILIYEMLDNDIPVPLWWMTMPVFLIVLFSMALYMTPFVRPLTFRQVIFTYLFPVIPFLFAWDAWASKPRVYTESDMKKLLKNSPSDEYEWIFIPFLNKQKRKRGLFTLGIVK